jgi:hypothetical protein
VQAVAGSVLAYADELALAMDAGLAQLGASVRQQAGLRTARAALRAAEAGTNFAASGTMAALADVVALSENVTVTMEGASHTGARSIDPLVFVLILLWLLALAMPAAQVHLTRRSAPTPNRAARRGTSPRPVIVGEASQLSAGYLPVGALDPRRRDP